MMDRYNFCQPKKIFFLALIALIAACTTVDEMDLPTIVAKASWFDNEGIYAVHDKNYNLDVHPFYDLVPFSSAVDQSINFYPLFSTETKYFKDLDLLSGHIYHRQKFVKHSDFWNEKRIVDQPNFTYGIVPRLIDQLGLVQNIVVFGNPKLYNDEINNLETISHRVRVVGGVYLQRCMSYPCNNNSEWLTRLLLVAVDTNDDAFKEVHDWYGLKRAVDWPYAKSFLENMYGGKKIDDAYLPNYRVRGEFDGSIALKTAVTKGHLYRYKELVTLKKSCHNLYDYVWENVVKIKNSKSPSLKKFYSEFVDKYGSEYSVCVSHVKNADINVDHNRFWFFQFFDAPFLLDKIGYNFDCRRGDWVKNPVNPLTKKRDFDSVKSLKNCKESRLEKAFRSMPLFMYGLSMSGNDFYNFIEYDEGIEGSHEKIYSWIFISGPTVPGSRYDVFKLPKDIEWDKIRYDQ